MNGDDTVKKIVLFLLTLSMLAGMLAGCAKDPAQTEAPSDGPTVPVTDPAKPSDPTDPADPTEPGIETITIAEALELCGEEGNITEERYYIRATIETITNAAYGAMVISDETGSIPVYGTYSEDGSVNYSELEDKPYKGDEVLLHCILQNYNGNKEVKNARLISFKHAENNFSEADYTSMSIADARKTEAGAKVKVQGVVAQITYANGMKPCGFYLVDKTNSIYVYDADTAQRVAVGNTVSIFASKTYWILDGEVANAEKYGYQGCCQLEEAYLDSNDESTDGKFDRSWIKESTVRDIVNTPFSQNITTTIFKVNAYVNKVEGNGFTNYYINDLDNETGSYTYSQCNGSDFSWLDEFDGKICTVYLSAINAKSTPSGCFYRFLPIWVQDDHFNVQTVNGPEYAVKHHAIDQFQTSYTGDPKLELITSVSNAELGIKDVAVSYSSSNTSVITFTKSGSKVIMNCLASGSATVTVTATKDGKSYSEKITITVTVAPKQEYISVKDAIGTEVGKKVTVKGIVGPSLVNQMGFYLIDDTGVIAVRTSEDVMKTLKIGNEVIITADRYFQQKDGTATGQTCLNDAVVVVNNYGTHEYATNTFVTGKTLQDFYDLDATKDYTTTVYVMNATVFVEETKYYTSILLTSGDTQVRLYCSSANQYSWLKAFADQEVTVEIAACNWNSKAYYAGCVLAVRTADGKLLNELNFSR